MTYPKICAFTFGCLTASVTPINPIGASPPCCNPDGSPNEGLIAQAMASSLVQAKALGATAAILWPWAGPPWYNATFPPANPMLFSLMKFWINMAQFGGLTPGLLLSNSMIIGGFIDQSPQSNILDLVNEVNAIHASFPQVKGFYIDSWGDLATAPGLQPIIAAHPAAWFIVEHGSPAVAQQAAVLCDPNNAISFAQLGQYPVCAVMMRPTMTAAQLAQVNAASGTIIRLIQI
jgi:hypothetical protein